MRSVKKGVGTTKRCCYLKCRSDTRCKAFKSLTEHLYYFISFPKPCYEYRRNLVKTTREQHIILCSQCAKCDLWVKKCGRRDGRFEIIDHVKKDTHICSLHFKGESGPTALQPDPISPVELYYQVIFY